MTGKDRHRWDQKWARFGDNVVDPDELLTEHRDLMTGGAALDLACGQGQNAIWLARHGFSVLAVDISSVALEAARKEAAAQGLADRIHYECADLDRWPLPTAAFNLICVFRFLDRDLFPAIREGLLPGGLLFYRTRHTGFLRRHQEANRAYLLEPGELSTVFGDWHILHYEEGPEEVELIAKKGGPTE